MLTSITELLSKEEIRAFTSTSDLQGWLSVCTTWSMIVAAFGLVAWHLSWWTVLVALILLGGRHLALAILMHECSHHSLFKTKQINNIVGKWLCAAPGWNDLARYRAHHLTHHAHTGTERDNDLGLVRPFPVSKAALMRKLLRDISGITGIKRMLGLVLMDTGFLSYSASTGQQRLPQHDRSAFDVFQTGIKYMGPILLTNTVIVSVLAAVGFVELYALWVVAYLTTFSLFIRIRSIAEHACTANSADMFKNTRTTKANWLARLTVAPHHVNYHLEHHALMTVPHYNLKKLHNRLRDAGVYPPEGKAPYADNYRQVLALATCCTDLAS